jgi:hypothetical protein
MTTKTCIYHANCPDGMAAAISVYTSPKWGSDTNFVTAHYGNPPPDVTGHDVIIVDFSYPRDVLEQMHAQANSLIVLDHHKTAQSALDGLDYCIFDMTKSGGRLTWDYLNPQHEWDAHPADRNIPDLILYTEDRDLWQNKLHLTKEYNAALASYPMTFEAWLPLLNNNETARMQLEGEAILRYQTQQVDRIVGAWKKSPRFISLPTPDGDIVAPLINTNTLISEVGERLAADYPCSCSYFDTVDNKRVYSLRSRGNTDVSAIAKLIGDAMLIYFGDQYSGGGHAQAAGFTTPIGEYHLPSFVKNL